VRWIFWIGLKLIRATTPRLGDLIVWDNWRTMHIATGHKRRYARVMHRTTLHGGVALSSAFS
jgi:taurine dioxygenase